MIDFSSYYNISKSIALSVAKAMHKPSLQDKEAMTGYAIETNSYGIKASFTSEQQANQMTVDYF